MGVRSRAARWGVLAGAVALVATVSIVVATPASATVASNSLLTLLAGTGTSGSAVGAGRVGTASQIGETYAVEDALGTVWISDTTNCRIHKLDRAGLITDVAGTTCGYGGDNGPATSAKLNGPTALTVRPNGDLYVADSTNCLIRKITAAGTISTVVGTVSGTTPQCGNTGDGGAATSAKLYAPNGVAVDSAGNIYVSDTLNCRVRKVTGTTINNFAGTGTCGYTGEGTATAKGFNWPMGIAVDSNGLVFVSDAVNQRVRAIVNGTTSTLAGTGTAGFTADGAQGTATQVNQPMGVSVDGGGQVFWADYNNCRIRRVSYAGGTVTTVVGPSTAIASPCAATVDRTAPGAARLVHPRGVWVSPGGDLSIADSGTYRVSVVNGVATALVGTPTALTRLDLDMRTLGNANASPRNWSSADATYSVVLNDGRVAWFYGDTWAGASTAGSPGYVNADHSRVGDGLIHNTMVVQTPSTDSFTTVWRSGAVGQPFVPDNANGHRYWPGQPYLVNSGATIRLPLAETDGTNIVGAAVVDITVATWAQSAVQAVTAAFTSLPYCGNKAIYGSAVLVNPDGSGKTYVYGIDQCVSGGTYFGSFLHVAQVSSPDLVNGTWKYWNVTTQAWQSTQPDGSAGFLQLDGAALSSAGHEMSVVKTTSGYRAVWTEHSITGVIDRATATSPTGPFTGKTTILTVPEQGAPTYNRQASACTLQGYNAKEHPEFEGSGEIVISYNVGIAAGCNDGQNGLLEYVHQVDNYRPRFIRLTAAG